MYEIRKKLDNEEKRKGGEWDNQANKKREKKGNLRRI